MNKILIAGLLLALYACNAERSSEKNTTISDSIFQKNTVVRSDTIYTTYPAFEEEISWEKQSSDTALMIDGKEYTLIWSAQPDSLKKLSFSRGYVQEKKFHKDIYFGYDISYEIAVYDKKQHLVFSKLFNKSLFYAGSDTGLVMVSRPALPDFLGFQQKFNAFLFTFNFGIPNSDVGIECFFMIDFQGKIIENFISNFFSGRCDGEITIPPSQNFILTCTKILYLYPDKKSINIHDENFSQIGIRLVNDTTILVIREYDEEKNEANALLINKSGQNLVKFTYRGYYQLLGYFVPIHFNPLTHSYYLLDKNLEQIRVINQANPVNTYTIDFEQMKKANGKIRSTEIEIGYDILGETDTFYVDRITKAIRRK